MKTPTIRKTYVIEVFDNKTAILRSVDGVKQVDLMSVEILANSKIKK